MNPAATIRRTHKAIREYHAELQRYTDQGLASENQIREAFKRLLSDLARARDWTLISELEAPTTGDRIVPDGTLRDTNHIARGYWEAKDTADNLEHEIRKKLARGYPSTNIIFEDSQRAVLYQEGRRVLEGVDLSDPEEVAHLLTTYFAYTEPQIEEFERAVDEFSLRVPELARGVADKIKEAHGSNAKFQAAFAEFFESCKKALNPNLSREAVDEMLVQHLLTERLIRTVFANQEFLQRNAIAAQVEHVIAALTSKSFSRREFLKGLDPFYVAIEKTAAGIGTFAEKQHFLNTIYERFFQGYCVRTADTHGIVYTPQPIVDFMCASVVSVLKSEFGKELGDDGVHLIDPCTGTGNFVVNLLRRCPPRRLANFYKHHLFANEVMLLPYYIASLNIEHEYRELMGEYEPFEGLCFVDTLDLAEEHEQDWIAGLSEKNSARVERQRRAPMMVIVGNPPYNVGQLNENDNNKNRKYPVIEQRIRDTYAKDSAATNKNALSDAYVKFFRWAADRLEGRDGIVCYVTNNSFVEQHAFDGMREHLLKDFTRVWHIDLHGNVRKNPKLSGTTHNVFGIQVGVGVTVAIRSGRHRARKLYYQRVPELWRKEQKLEFLNRAASIVQTDGLDPASTFPYPRSVVPPWQERPAPAGTMRERKAASTRGRHEQGAHATGEIERRHGANLPHWTKDRAAYFVTFRLADSLPRPVADQWRAERDALLGAARRGRLLGPADLARLHQLFSERFDTALDAGGGAAWMKDPAIADLVAAALGHFDGERYDLLAWCVMPNHVHVVVQLIGEWALDAIMHSWKSFASKAANKALGRTGSFWQKESYDHLVRDEADLRRCVAYVIENPAKAGLKKWRWVGAAGPPGSPGSPWQERPAPAGTTHEQDAHATEACWHLLEPDARHDWLVPDNAALFATFLPIGSKEAKAVEEDDAETIFRVFSGGLKTNRDDVVYDFDRAALVARVTQFIEDYNAEVDRYKRAKPKPSAELLDNFVKYDSIKWSETLKNHVVSGDYAEFAESKIRRALYRPFCDRQVFFDRLLNERVYVLPSIFPDAKAEAENGAIWLKVGAEWPAFALLTNKIPDLLPSGGSQCFPFYVYDEDGTNRRENITDWALEQFRTHYKNRRLTKWDIFHYVYGVLHHPGYRTAFADCLKRELPRIPFAPDFATFRDTGKRLAELHLTYESAPEYPLEWIDLASPWQERPAPAGTRHEQDAHATRVRTPDRAPFTWRVEKMKLAKDKQSLRVNDQLTLAGIPADAFEYRLGNRSALEWVIDQYQVSADKRTGIASDPNRTDDPEYIVRLVGRVITVSVETVKIVHGLPEKAW